jgi:hypothetical protein
MVGGRLPSYYWRTEIMPPKAAKLCIFFVIFGAKNFGHPVIQFRTSLLITTNSKTWRTCRTIKTVSLVNIYKLIHKVLFTILSNS